MNPSTETPQWMQDASVQTIPREKLFFLQEAFAGLQGKNQKQAMTVLLPLLKKAKKEGLTLTGEEMQTAIQAIRKYSTRTELEQIDRFFEGQVENMGKKM